MRVGIGWDIHRLDFGRPFILGGIELFHDKGPVGHSDGDALTHAIADAILGAAGLGDIGERFPDSDPEWEGVSSVRTILPAVVEMARKAGWRVSQVDSTVILESPKLAEHKVEIRDCLAKALGIEPSRVNVKAKTGEGQGEVGRQEAFVAQAVVVLEPLTP